jgi:hypothetical protein
MVRGMLPYPEPRRRRRVRAAARALVTCETWPDDDHVTGPDVAQLAQPCQLDALIMLPCE